MPKASDISLFSTFLPRPIQNLGDMGHCPYRIHFLGKLGRNWALVASDMKTRLSTISTRVLIPELSNLKPG